MGLRSWVKSIALRLVGKAITYAPKSVQYVAKEAEDAYIVDSLNRVGGGVRPKIKEIAEMDLRRVNGSGLGSSPSDPDKGLGSSPSVD